MNNVLENSSEEKSHIELAVTGSATQISMSLEELQLHFCE